MEEESQRIIFDSIPAFVWLKDRENRILKISNHAARALGRTPSEIEGRPTEEFYPDEAGKYWADDLEVIHCGEPKRGIIEQMVSASGEKFWCRTDKIPYRSVSGEIIGVIVFAIDITERMVAEDELRKKTFELEGSNRDLEHFARIASHDLQEPLRMVASYVELLEHQYKNCLDAQALEYLHFADEGARRMRDMIQDLLDYSRTGNDPAPLGRMESHMALEAALRFLEPAVAQLGAEITISELPVVRGNGQQLTRLFQNLIGNALKYHGSSKPRVQISARPEGSHWIFRIRDNGIGIEEKDFGRIFDLFQRLHSREEYPGSGMGLAICKKIVERNGGRIWVTSSLDEGSSFYFTLPACGSLTKNT